MEGRMNINRIKVSGWYPSNLVKPVKVNGDVFKRERIAEKEIDVDEEEEIKDKDQKITKLKNEMKNIQMNPVKKLSSEHNEFSYTRRLVPLYRMHITKNL